MNGAAHFISVIDGRPRFAKHPIDDGKKVEIAAIDPDFNRGGEPLSLMECAGRLPIAIVALEVLQHFWVWPTTVLPVLPSRRECLSNRWVWVS